MDILELSYLIEIDGTFAAVSAADDVIGSGSGDGSGGGDHVVDGGDDINSGGGDGSGGCGGGSGSGDHVVVVGDDIDNGGVDDGGFAVMMTMMVRYLHTNGVDNSTACSRTT